MDDAVKNIDHPNILVKRIIAEIENGNIDNALYLTDTFVFLFSDYKEPRTELISAYANISNKLIKDGLVDQAETIVAKALLLSPDDSELLSILVKIKKFQRATLKNIGMTSTKDLSFKFIKKHFPEELSIFDAAWRVFKNIHPKDFVNMPIPEALGLVGPGDGDLITPQVIILLNVLSRKVEKVHDSKKIEGFLSDIGQEIGCSEELLNKIIKSVSEEYF